MNYSSRRRNKIALTICTRSLGWIICCGSILKYYSGTHLCPTPADASVHNDFLSETARKFVHILDLTDLFNGLRLLLSVSVKNAQQEGGIAKENNSHKKLRNFSSESAFRLFYPFRPPYVCVLFAQQDMEGVKCVWASENRILRVEPLPPLGSLSLLRSHLVLLAVIIPLQKDAAAVVVVVVSKL